MMEDEKKGNPLKLQRDIQDSEMVTIYFFFFFLYMHIFMNVWLYTDILRNFAPGNCSLGKENLCILIKDSTVYTLLEKNLYF